MNEIILGEMPVPPHFKYMDVYRHGKPQHDRFDSFRLRHPAMPLEQRAKIFAPFDALRGFDFAIRENQSAFEEENL